MQLTLCCICWANSVWVQVKDISWKDWNQRTSRHYQGKSGGQAPKSKLKERSEPKDKTKDKKPKRKPNGPESNET